MPRRSRIPPNRRPGLAIAGLAPHAVERHGDLSIGPAASEFADRLDGARRRARRAATGLHPRHAKLAVPAAGPVDQQHDLVGRTVEVADDLVDQDMNETLLGARVRRRRIPGRGQILGEPHQDRAVDPGASGGDGAQLLDPALNRDDLFQGAVPARLQLAGDKTLGGVDQFVPARRQARLVARRFEVALRRGDDFVRRPLDLIRGENGGFDGAIGDGFEKLQGDGAIDANAASPDAQSGPDMRVVATTLVPMSVAFSHAVEHAHHPAAPSAAHKAGQQRASAARRFACAVALHIGVLQQQLLVVLVLAPGDVGGVIVAQQNRPLLARGFLKPLTLWARPSTIRVRCAFLPNA